MELFSGSKLIYHLDRLSAWQQGAIPNPILLDIDMTSECNHHCPDCTCRHYRLGSFLTLEKAESALTQAIGLSVKAAVFTGGGEPLLNPHTPRAMEFAKRKGLSVGLITNGSLVTLETARSIVDSCVWCRVSVDAADEFFFRRTHGIGREGWQEVLGGIALLVEERQRAKSRITIGMGYLVNEDTIIGVNAAIRMASQLGVDYIQLRPFRDTDFDITPMMNDILMSGRAQQIKVYFSESRYSSFSKPREYSRCRAPNFNIVIGADNKVYTCCETKYRSETTVGDLDQMSLREIWYSESREKMDGVIYSFCPHPCRHNTNNRLLWDLEQRVIHEDFI